MNATIGIYNSHDLAVDAVIKLKNSGFPVSELSIIGLMETEVMDKDQHVIPKYTLKLGELGIGTLAGTTLGILTGIGVFAIPGVGFLFGAGAVIGAIAGFDVGLIGGGLASAMASLGVKDDNTKKYHDALVAGKFLVTVHGKGSDVNKARDILHEHGTHDELAVH
jgi:uncharacterized membrane protein